MSTKWGIIGTGNICTDFVICLDSLPKSEHEIVGVVDIKVDAAESFAKLHKISKIYSSYEELANDRNVEVVYIGTINPTHFQICKLMLEAKKHVLCEKPMTMNFTDTEKLIDLAKQNKTFLMEALWSRCCPIYKQLQNEIANGKVGNPEMIQVMFAFPLLDKERVVRSRLGGSAVLDLGIYAIQLVTLIYGSEKPQKITAVGSINNEGVDEVALISLQYSKERIASIIISTRSQGHNEAVITGSKGIVRLHSPFHCPSIMEINTKKFEMTLPTVHGELRHINSEGLVYEANEVRRCLKLGLLQCPQITHKDTLMISYITSEVRRQLQAQG